MMWSASPDKFASSNTSSVPLLWCTGSLCTLSLQCKCRGGYFDTGFVSEIVNNIKLFDTFPSIGSSCNDERVALFYGIKIEILKMVRRNNLTMSAHRNLSYVPGFDMCQCQNVRSFLSSNGQELTIVDATILLSY